MSKTKAFRGSSEAGELASLLTQLNEKKGQVERLLARVEDVLRGSTTSGKSSKAAESVVTGASPARSSPLDKVKAVVESTADLRESNGNLSAVRVAKVFGVSLSQLAAWLEIGRAHV